MASILLFLLVLSADGTIANQLGRYDPGKDGPFALPPQDKLAEGAGLLKSYDELKTMYSNLKSKLNEKISLMEQDTQRPRIYGVNSVAVDPLFLDLDNIDAFNDISNLDVPTVGTDEQTTTTSTTVERTTLGPLVVGHDALGRQILRFVNHWEQEIEGDSTTTTFTTPSTTTTTTATTTPVTTTSSTTTTIDTTKLPTTTITSDPQPVTDLLVEAREEGTPLVIVPDFDFQTDTEPLVRGEAPEAISPPMDTVEEIQFGGPLVVGSDVPATSLPPVFETSPSFSSKSPFVERLFPSFITEVTQSPIFGIGTGDDFAARSVEEVSQTTTAIPTTTNEEAELIWWTPKPSFLGISSILDAPPPSPAPRPVEPESLWRPRWTMATTTAAPFTVPLDVEQKVRKIAEQSVLNELELVAESMDMPELVRELRGEQQLPPLLNSAQAERYLASKRRTLKQLEILDRLASRKNELQQLIAKQKVMLSNMKDTQTKVVKVHSLRGNRLSERQTANEAWFGTTTIRSISEDAPWARKRGFSGRKRRQRQKLRSSRVSNSLRWQMVDEHVPTVEELTELLEREMRLTQRLALEEGMREFCTQTACDFEKGDFCRYETSYDEATRRKRKRRSTRAVSDSAPIYVIRSWFNWLGSYSANSSRVDKAIHFSPRNSRFGGVFLEPSQLASLSVSISFKGSFSLRFRAWEPAQGVRLRVCCNDYCPFSTEIGRSTKRWRNLRAECPAETRQLAFECENVGNKKGVCAIDDVVADGCETFATDSRS